MNKVKYFVADCPIRFNGKLYPVGTEFPFNPPDNVKHFLKPLETPASSSGVIEEDSKTNEDPQKAESPATNKKTIKHGRKKKSTNPKSINQ